MKTKNLYIIASTMDGVGLGIETFWEPSQATRRMKALVDKGFRKPEPDESPESYHAAYQKWVKEENGNMCENDIELLVEKIPQVVPYAQQHQEAKQPAQPTEPDNPELSNEQKLLNSALKTWRRDRGIELKMPDMMILTNTVLFAIAKANPRTLEDLKKIKGMGPQKMSLLGEDIIAIVNAF